LATYGWIREDGLEAFYEGTDRFRDPGPPADPTYRCPFCSAIYTVRQELKAHVASEHKVERPILFIKGKEPAQRFSVRTKLSEADVFVQNATIASVAVNGDVTEGVSIESAMKQLVAHSDVELSISLINDVGKKSTPVISKYDLSIRAASVEQLRGVERAFDDVLMDKAMTRAAIGLFLEDQRTKGVAAEYATGLAEYALGVLLKERPDTEPLTTPFARYREAYGSALERISDFDRPLANLISSLIRFAMNDFSAWNTQTGFWELDLANAALHNPVSKSIEHIGDLPASRRPICPVDHGTGKILALTERMIGQDRWSPILDEECRGATSTDVLDATDSQKALAIWAAAAWRLGAKENAVEPLRQIAATYPFSIWAEPYLESVSN
jgi:hypothetical protein